MKILIKQNNSDWTMNAVLFKENENKIFVYSGRIEWHFPKHLFTYEKLED